MKADLVFACHEDWNKMTPTQKGAFCNACKKDVLDLTGKDGTSIKEILDKEKQGAEVCARFRPKQLFDLNFSDFFRRFLLWNLRKRIAVIFFFVLGGSLFSCTPFGGNGGFDEPLAGAVAFDDSIQPPDDSLMTVKETEQKQDTASLARTGNRDSEGKNMDSLTEVKTSSSGQSFTCVFPIVKFPEFPGGNPALARFIDSCFVYPIAALENKIEGRVIVQFRISSEGKIIDPQIKKGIGFGCDEEALRVIRQLPAWTPGDTGIGTVTYTLPVNLKLPSPIAPEKK